MLPFSVLCMWYVKEYIRYGDEDDGQEYHDPGDHEIGHMPLMTRI
jgi:hypothetical protein